MIRVSSHALDQWAKRVQRNNPDADIIDFLEESTIKHTPPKWMPMLKDQVYKHKKNPDNRQQYETTTRFATNHQYPGIMVVLRKDRDGTGDWIALTTLTKGLRGQYKGFKTKRGV